VLPKSILKWHLVLRIYHHFSEFIISWACVPQALEEKQRGSLTGSTPRMSAQHLYNTVNVQASIAAAQVCAFTE
jgi:hypothetical protein